MSQEPQLWHSGSAQHQVIITGVRHTGCAWWC